MQPNTTPPSPLIAPSSLLTHPTRLPSFFSSTLPPSHSSRPPPLHAPSHSSSPPPSLVPLISLSRRSSRSPSVLSPSSPRLPSPSPLPEAVDLAVLVVFCCPANATRNHTDCDDRLLPISPSDRLSLSRLQAYIKAPARSKRACNCKWLMITRKRSPRRRGAAGSIVS